MTPSSHKKKNKMKFFKNIRLFYPLLIIVYRFLIILNTFFPKIKIVSGSKTVTLKQETKQADCYHVAHNLGETVSTVPNESDVQRFSISENTVHPSLAIKIIIKAN